MAVAAARRRAHGDEDRIRPLHRLIDVGREGEPAVLDVVLHQLVEAGLEDGHAPVAQAFDLGAVLVDADHIDAELREAGARDEADIAGADDGDPHERDS